MKRGVALLAMMAASATATAAPPPIPPMTDAELRGLLDPGQEIEARLDRDFNGDGELDTALALRSDDDRVVRVYFTIREKFSIERDLAGSFRLQPAPMGSAELSLVKDVLVIRDLTGGTTATETTYRFRADKAEPRMRLIGLDVGVYSRTFSHDGSEMSWNLLTGDVIATELKLTGAADDSAYDKRLAKRFRRPVAVYFMDDTPDVEEALGMAIEGK